MTMNMIVKSTLGCVGLATLMLLGGCTTATVYTAEEFSTYQEEHKIVAILPYSVHIELKKLPEGTTEADIREMESDEGLMFQRILYGQFLEQYSKRRYTVEFQDIDKTNTLLTRSDIDFGNMTKYTKDELAAVLGVDALISGHIKRDKPMSTAAAIWSTVLIGVGNTNQVHVSMAVHDGATGKLLWSYDNDVGGGLGSSPEKLAKSLMDQISKKFPYEP